MLEGVQKLVDSAAGSMICAAVDVTKLPEAAQAFGVSGVRGRCRSAGRLAPIYTGPVSAEDLGDVLSQVLQLAAQYQRPAASTRSFPTTKSPCRPCTQKPSRRPRPRRPGGCPRRIPAITENPGDKEAKLGLEQVELLARVKDLTWQPNVRRLRQIP